MTEVQINDRATAIIIEALKDSKIARCEIDHIMSLVKSYGNLRHTEGKAEGIEKATAVYKRNEINNGHIVQFVTPIS